MKPRARGAAPPRELSTTLRKLGTVSALFWGALGAAAGCWAMSESIATGSFVLVGGALLLWRLMASTTLHVDLARREVQIRRALPRRAPRVLFAWPLEQLGEFRVVTQRSSDGDDLWTVVLMSRDGSTIPVVSDAGSPKRGYQLYADRGNALLRTARREAGLPPAEGPAER